jgi:NADPH-dependent glutamate synthase beta subunit-like oxidoreductase
MIKLKINGKEIEATHGATILDILKQEGIEVPTMCFLDNSEHFPTCMVCIVKDQRTDKLVPSCSTHIATGMDIITDDEEVIEARKTSLELLLSDHVGECDAPCQTNCPAFMDIPLMNRLLAEGKFDEALRVVKRDIALPAVLGRICPAPCERACRRRNIDEPVSICTLKRYAADHDLGNPVSFMPETSPSNGKKIGIIGSGPAGLSAAYFLIQKGYKCTLYDKNPLPGGALRYAIPDDRLPKEVLDQEIDIIRQMGAEFIQNYELPADGFEKLRAEFDGMIIATGEDNAEFAGLEKKNKSFVTERNSYQTNIKGVFAIGSAIKPGRVAIRAVAHGKEAAITMDQYLHDLPVVGEPQLFNSRIGRMLEEEYDDFMLEADAGPRNETRDFEGFTMEQVQKEAARCMHCDCRKKFDCKLRDYSGEYDASQKRFFPKERPPVRKIFKHKPLVYEPEKCIKCSICVRITAQHKEELGLTYIGKGFDVEISAPFNDEQKNALEKTAILCAEKCPTSALALNKIGEIDGD